MLTFAGVIKSIEVHTNLLKIREDKNAYVIPKQDVHVMDKGFLLSKNCQQLVDQLCVAMGGRVAEELTFGNVTNGAVGDIHMATNIARKMVCEWGMSEDLGMVEYGQGEGEVFLARDIGKSNNYSEETARKIDAEIKKLIDDAYALAKDLLIKHNDKLKLLAEALLEYETLDAGQVSDLLKHGEMKNPPSPPGETVVPGNQADEGVPKKSIAEDSSSDDDPLAGEAIGAPA